MRKNKQMNLLKSHIAKKPNIIQFALANIFAISGLRAYDRYTMFVPKQYNKIYNILYTYPLRYSLIVLYLLT